MSKTSTSEDAPIGAKVDPDRALKSFLGSEEKNVKREILKASYTPLKRASDITWSLSFAALLVPCIYNIWYYSGPDSFSTIAICFVLAMAASDFFSGLAHWGADTWGSFDTPFFGPTFIRSFREHHLAPTAMAQHDIFETNGDNCLLTIPVLFILARKDCLNADGTVDPVAYFSLTFWTWVCMWVSLTNQIHAWSHTQNPPKFVSILQTLRIILSPEAHRKHHQIPFDKNYCITNGWMDYPLNYINFWRRAETFVTKVTGFVPREDDYKWTGISTEMPDVVQRKLNAKKK